MTANAPIDFDEILNSVVWEMQEGFPDRTDKDCILRGLKEVAFIVEEETIQRCYRILMTEKGGIERLYGSSSTEGKETK